MNSELMVCRNKLIQGFALSALACDHYNNKAIYVNHANLTTKIMNDIVYLTKGAYAHSTCR